MYAYILIATDDVGVEELIDEFKDMAEVVEAHILFGEWDMIVKLNVKETLDVTRFVLEKVRSNDTVRFSSTLIVAK